MLETSKVRTTIYSMDCFVGGGLNVQSAFKNSQFVVQVKDIFSKTLKFQIQHVRGEGEVTYFSP